jgi:hypothetical protein
MRSVRRLRTISRTCASGTSGDAAFAAMSTRMSSSQPGPITPSGVVVHASAISGLSGTFVPMNRPFESVTRDRGPPFVLTFISATSNADGLSCASAAALASKTSPPMRTRATSVFYFAFFADSTIALSVEMSFSGGALLLNVRM